MTRKKDAADQRSYLEAPELERLEASFRRWAAEPETQGNKISRARMLLIFLLIRYTGSKLSEVLALDLERDIDIVRRTVTFQGTGKTREAREVEISQGLAEEVKALLPLLLQNADRSFAVDPSLVRRTFYARAEASGLDPACSGPEMIRKARAIELMRNKLPLPAVQRLFGRLAPSRSMSLASFSDDDMQRLTRLYLDRETGGKTSARNSFYGKVRSLSRDGVQALVEITATDGEPLYTVITNASVSRLGLKPGILVTAEVKAPWLSLESVERTGFCSAENVREGTIRSLTPGEVNTECVVETTGGIELVSVLSTPGFQRLGLGPGDAVRVLFSANAVILKVD